MTQRAEVTSTLEQALDAFLAGLEGKNRAASTIAAYRTDLLQFIGWLHDNNLVAQTPDDVERADITEYLTHLSRSGVSGITRARKLAVIREYFRFLEANGLIARSPTLGIETPKKERGVRTYLSPDEYSRIPSLAGASARDYCILQVFLETGIRVGELCNLRLDDVQPRGGPSPCRAKPSPRSSSN